MTLLELFEPIADLHGTPIPLTAVTVTLLTMLAAYNQNASGITAIPERWNMMGDFVVVIT